MGKNVRTREGLGHFLFDLTALWTSEKLGEKRPSWDDIDKTEQEGMCAVAVAFAKNLGVEVEPGTGEEIKTGILVEMSLPPQLEGTEVLRVFMTPDHTMVLVNPGAMHPPAWGLTLHDVAKNIANGAVETKLVSEEDGEVVLDTICDFFVAERENPTDVAKPFEPRMDS